jgi:hypothetical protein
LSRLNAQSGSFILDFRGILNKIIIKNNIGIRLVFKHTKDEKTLFDKDKVKLFPFPNQLETEIMRIMTEESRKNGLPIYYETVQNIVGEKEGELINEIPTFAYKKGFKAESIPFQDLFIPSFGGYKWEKRKINDFNYKPIEVDKKHCTDVFIPLTLESVLELVEHIINAIKSESLCDYLVMLRFNEKTYVMQDEQFFIESVSTLMNYQYAPSEIAEVLLEIFKIAIFIMNEYDGNMSNLGRFAWEKYYGCKSPIIYLSDGDKYNKYKLFLPETYTLLEGQCEEEFNAFDKSEINIPELYKSYIDELGENARVLLYQSYPHKIISYEKIKKLFLDIVLPQQFFFPHGQRIYIPDYICTMGLAFMGREVRMW